MAWAIVLAAIWALACAEVLFLIYKAGEINDRYDKGTKRFLERELLNARMKGGKDDAN